MVICYGIRSWIDRCGSEYEEIMSDKNRLNDEMLENVSGGTGHVEPPKTAKEDYPPILPEEQKKQPRISATRRPRI